MFSTQSLLPHALIRMFLMAFLLIGMAFNGQAQGCSQPSNLNSEVLNASTVALSWSEIGGATSYTVQYRVGSSGPWKNGGTVTTTNQVIGNLLAETIYTWRVRASCSTYSSVATFNSGGGVGGNPDCSSPSNLDFLSLTSTSGTLSWSEIEGALYYTVQFRVGSSGPWTNAGSVTVPNLTLTGLLPNTAYTWRVKASCSVYSSIAEFNTGVSGGSGGGGGSPSCSAPSNTNTNWVLPTSAEVSWEAQGGALDYVVQYRLASGSVYTTVGTFTVAVATINGLLPGREYVWRVKANCSPYGSDVQFSTPLAMGSGAGLRQSDLSTNTTLIFPNPVLGDEVQIQAPAPGALIQVFNSAGQMVVSQRMNDTQAAISVANWNNGLYYARIQFEQGASQTLKFVLAH